MMVARVGSHTVNPAMKANLPYEIDDFDYIGVFEINPVVCAVSPNPTSVDGRPDRQDRGQPRHA